MSSSSTSLLSVRNLRVSFGGIEAVKGIDLEVRPGELVTLIGANGAGKTTTLKAITNTLASSQVTDVLLQALLPQVDPSILRRS